MHRHSASRPAAPRAFTLIELLTVIAIIGILAAIIIPTVGKVRATARNAQCTARLRDWSRAINLFAADNKGKYQISNWLSASSNPYAPYFPKLVPSGTTVRVDFWATCPLLGNDPASAAVSYSMIWPSINGDIATRLPSPATGNQMVPLNQARNPSLFLAMVDSMKGSSPRISGNTTADFAQMIDPLFGADPVNPGTRGDTTVSTRHGGARINGLFGDGSVRGINGKPEESGDTGSIYAMRTTWFLLN